MRPEFSSTITEQQKQLADQVEGALRQFGLSFSRVTGPSGNGPAIEFAVATTLGIDRQLVITLYQSSFHIIIGPAEVRIEVGEDFERDASECLAALQDLLPQPLRLRIRNTLSGRQAGAIYFGKPGKGGWSGDLWSCLGLGKREAHDQWFKRA